MLVISFIGFQNDTIHVSKKNQELDITLREGVEPVSYTHLDVYKRQGQ